MDDNLNMANNHSIDNNNKNNPNDTRKHYSNLLQTTYTKPQASLQTINKSNPFSTENINLSKEEKYRNEQKHRIQEMFEIIKKSDFPDDFFMTQMKRLPNLRKEWENLNENFGNSIYYPEFGAILIESAFNNRNLFDIRKETEFIFSQYLKIIQRYFDTHFINEIEKNNEKNKNDSNNSITKDDQNNTKYRNFNDFIEKLNDNPKNIDISELNVAINLFHKIFFEILGFTAVNDLLSKPFYENAN